ncbi:MAG: T9SS type A sorting domain-containing protein, partial [Bacteroidota bacterium]
STVCAGTSSVAYSVATVSNATSYVWTVPAGTTIAGGVGTNSITLNYSQSATSGGISVHALNACGDGPSSAVLPVTVNTLPSSAGTVNGTNTVCQGSAGIVYSLSAVTGATSYSWTVPAGATIVSGGTTNNISVDFGMSATSGNITVNGVNNCGPGIASTIAITVNSKPATPTITQNVNILNSNAATGNQWYRDGYLIPGATSQSHTILQDGTYTVIVTLNGCSSDVSNSIIILHTDIASLDIEQVKLYPNPGTGSFWLSVTSPVSTIYDMQVLNALGACVFTAGKLEVNGTFKQYFDLHDLSAGIYSLVLRSATQQIVRKIVINK